MIKNLLNVSSGASLAELCKELGQTLGMDKAVPVAVLRRATEDPVFANDLLTCRGAPGFLSALFDDPRTLAYAPAAQEKKASTLALTSKAAAAMVRWGKAGFSTVDDVVLERRESACLKCPNLGDSYSVLQKLVAADAPTNKLGGRLGGKVCKLCGCVGSKKIRLPSESCPDQHPVQSDMTRWMEPLPAIASELVPMRG